MRLLQDGDHSVLFRRLCGLTRFLVSVVVVLFTANCAGINQANHAANPFAPTSPLAASVVAQWERELPQTDITTINTKAERNDLVYRLIFLSDYRFNRYEADLMLGKATRDTFIDLSMFGLNAATALITPGTASQILGAIAGGLGFSRNTIEKNFYMNHTAPVLMARMHALRKEKLNEIVLHLSRDIDEYPASLAIVDVLDYYNRGTMLGALQSISDDTAVKEIRAAGGSVTAPPKAPPVSQQISQGTVAGQAPTFARRPVRQTQVPPQFHDDRSADVEALASAVNKTINAKALSVDQLNRFCDQADLLRPDALTTGTEEEKLEAAKGAVMKQVRGITQLGEIQKVATAATTIFGPPNL
jgi:hypothetical protein